MKIKMIRRALLIAMSLLMVLALFACGNDKTEDTTVTTDVATEVETVEEDTVADTAAETDTAVETDPEEDGTTAPDDSKCQHVEEIIPGKKHSCTETGLTDGIKCTKCGETLKEQEVIPAYHNLQYFAAQLGTCVEAGTGPYYKCRFCQMMFDVNDNVIDTVPSVPSGHQIAKVEAKAPTCKALGNEVYYACVNCDEIWSDEKGENAIAEIPSIAIDPEAHSIKDVAYIAPTTAQKGLTSHKTCEYCKKLWNTAGEETTSDALAIPVLTYDTNYYFGVEELKSKKLEPTAPHEIIVSEDRSYVRYSRTGEGNDGYVFLINEKTATKASGKYLIMKYRTNEPYIGGYAKTETGDLGNDDGITVSIKGDGNWHILTIDLSASKTFVANSSDGNYYARAFRLDLLDAMKSTGYFDVAFIALTDDLAKVQSILVDGDSDICSHMVKEGEVPVNKGDYHSFDCLTCGGEAKEEHTAQTYKYDTDKMAYVGQETCACGGQATKEMLYTSEARSTNDNVNCVTVTREDGFTRYTATTEGNKDLYFHIYMGGEKVTGQYMVIKYRLVNNGKNASAKSLYAGSAMSTNNVALGNGDGSGITGSGSFLGDGEWHYYLISVDPTKNTQFADNGDGTYSFKYLRMGFNSDAFDGSCYMDIDFIAFADNEEAAKNFAFKNEKNPAFIVNMDNSFNKIDENFVFETDSGSGIQRKTIEVDFTGKTLQTATSVKMGGWLCTQGGVASYEFRVVEIDGVAVEEPTKNTWIATPGDRDDVYTKIGIGNGYNESCQNGAGMNTTTLDLSAYAGKTVKIELVANTNYGAEIVYAVLSNVTVPATVTE